jgi:hypothetical protein
MDEVFGKRNAVAGNAHRVESPWNDFLPTPPSSS